MIFGFYSVAILTGDAACFEFDSLTDCFFKIFIFLEEKLVCMSGAQPVKYKPGIDHVTCYKFKWKINISKKNSLRDLNYSVNAVILTNERIEFITGHMTYNPAYT